MRYLFFGFLILLTLSTPKPLSSAMTGGSFEVYADAISFIDTDPQTGGTFSLYATGGEFAVSTTQSGVIELRSGFQAAERTILGFSVNPSTIAFNSVSLTSVSTSSLTLTVNTASSNGYTLSLSEDGNLRSGANEIDDIVSGQSFVAGTEAYGVVPSGVDALITTTTPITQAGTNIASYSAVATARETDLEFRLGVASGTPIGTYSHALTFTITVNP